MITSDIVDLYAPAAPGSLMRCAIVEEIGRFRLARRGCELYSVQIVCSGSWARITLTDGKGRRLWHQPSAFTGSFWLGGGAEDGLIVELHSKDHAPTLTINWREPDQKMI